MEDATLEMLAERSGVELERLPAGGLRLVSVTNSPLDVATEELDHAGLGGHFDAVL